MHSRRADGTMMIMMLTGHTRMMRTARVHGSAKEQKGVNGVGTAGQHAKQCAHEDENETRQNTDFTAGHPDTIYLSWESPSGDLSRDDGYLRVPS
jgi:hypothetical protein